MERKHFNLEQDKIIDFRVIPNMKKEEFEIVYRFRTNSGQEWEVEIPRVKMRPEIFYEPEQLCLGEKVSRSKAELVYQINGENNFFCHLKVEPEYLTKKEVEKELGRIYEIIPFKGKDFYEAVEFLEIYDIEVIGDDGKPRTGKEIYSDAIRVAQHLSPSDRDAIIDFLNTKMNI